ncbi:hypothetical protein OQJ40_22530 [Serratia nevei]|uniref:hypothetical protein n=1 Tax=Serratia nevei TaxID=2703794 RepID=UPI0011532FF5|nr:hypothetical protein [Serratia nevei]QDI34859.1 hypothetical protein FG170_22205 [Serratia marcescens]WMC74936.1 hypothetical protein O8I25_22285 [Serratia nevei]WMC80334.1 hypothetical protein O8I24_22520 [Serratia nevei]
MTEKNEEMIPMTPAKKGLLRSKTFWLVTGGVVVVLILGMVGAGAVTHVDQRIAQLEKAQKALAPQDGMNSMADVVQTHAKQLKSLAERQDSLTRQIGALTLTNGLPEKLEQQLQAQQVELNVLKDSIESVKKSATEKPASTVAPSTSVPAAPSATAKITPKHKPTPIKSSPRNAVRRVVSKAPFVLTGVELRGTSAFAAVAPQGFSDLSQVRLIGEGESVAGWTLVSAGYGQATFRVNGRLQTVSAQ